MAYSAWSGLQANSDGLVSDSTGTRCSGYRIAADGVDSAGTVYELTGDYVTGKLHM